MDPNQITTTFIPKKPIEEDVNINNPVARRSVPAGTLFIFSIILLIITAVSLGGLFFYNKITQTDLEQLRTSLSRNEKEYEPSLLADLTKLDKRLKNGSAVLSQHVAISPIFDLIEQYTLKTVRFSKFDLKTSDTGQYIVTLSGEADNYQSIALQSQSFGDISAFKGVIFSDFTLTPKNRISFNTSFTVSPEILYFKTAPLKQIVPTATTAAPSSSTTSSIVTNTTTTAATDTVESVSVKIPTSLDSQNTPIKTSPGQ